MGRATREQATNRSTLSLERPSSASGRTRASDMSQNRWALVLVKTWWLWPTAQGEPPSSHLWGPSGRLRMDMESGWASSLCFLYFLFFCWKCKYLKTFNVADLQLGWDFFLFVSCVFCWYFFGNIENAWNFKLGGNGVRLEPFLSLPEESQTETYYTFNGRITGGQYQFLKKWATLEK